MFLNLTKNLLHFRKKKILFSYVKPLIWKKRFMINRLIFANAFLDSVLVNIDDLQLLCV